MKNTQDLLHGNIKSELIALTIPLVLGNILQQFYNTIDSFIVGRYVGTEAFAGIGVAGSIMNLFIFTSMVDVMECPLFLQNSTGRKIMKNFEKKASFR